MCEQRNEPAKKCSRAGCENHRYEDSDFCLGCRVSGRHTMRARATCDELPALPERGFREIFLEEVGAFKRKWSGTGLADLPRSK